MLSIDQFSYVSKLRFKSPALKSFFAVSILLMTVAVHSSYFGIAVTVLMGVISIRAGGVPVKRYLRLLCVPLAFIILSIVAIVIQITKLPMDGIYFGLFGYYIGTNSLALKEGIRIFTTAFGAVSCLYFLALSTPMVDIMLVLKKMHCPALILELMLLIYRFIFVLLEIAGALSIAQKSRLGNRNLKTAIQSAGDLLAVLFLRSFGKSSALYDAMESRCYDGNLKVLYEYQATNKKELAAVGSVIVMLLFLGLIG